MSSVRSAVVRPLSSPRSTRSCRRQLYTVWSLIPRSWGDVLDAASGRDKVQHPLTKLRGVIASSHAVLQCLGGTAAWSIPIIRLQEIQGALAVGPHGPSRPLMPASGGSFFELNFFRIEVYWAMT